jgi:nitrate/nitrite transporter NarK
MFIGEMVLLALALVAATGKIGAVLTEFFFPLLALTCLVGALIPGSTESRPPACIWSRSDIHPP